MFTKHQHHAFQILVEDHGPIVAIDMVKAVADAREEFGKLFGLSEKEASTKFAIAATIIERK